MGTRFQSLKASLFYRPSGCLLCFSPGCCWTVTGQIEMVDHDMLADIGKHQGSVSRRNPTAWSYGKPMSLQFWQCSSFRAASGNFTALPLQGDESCSTRCHHIRYTACTARLHVCLFSGCISHIHIRLCKCRDFCQQA